MSIALRIVRKEIDKYKIAYMALTLSEMNGNECTTVKNSGDCQTRIVEVGL